ncbi:Zinc transporter foi [Cryptotermes secundus]|uniref:Zinc transporter foi n=2 Tax=Cryptotermes secundus TaxID=105785 RepID=A0A2J7QRF0_9NEOP|nr:Zinc transporter foi [Cryptotermes secundus]
MWPASVWARMGRPFITTAVCCVFCFLCAEHAQCSLHRHATLLSKTHNSVGTPRQVAYSSSIYTSLGDVLRTQRRRRSDGSDVNRHDGDTSSHTGHEHHKSHIDMSSDSCRHTRDTWDVSEEQVFVKRLFSQFGEGDTMTFEGFERLLRTVGLQRLISPARGGHSLNSVPLSNIANVKLEANASRPDAIVSSDDMSEGDTHSNQTAKCLSGKELFFAFAGDQKGKLLPESLQRLCPGLLYQLTDMTTDCIMVSVPGPEAHGMDISTEVVSHSAVWLYATLSIVVVSLCGLLGVAVIPVMQRVFYQQLLQFLVALAVGTLCGDALLHLLPHAMMGEPHSHTSSPTHHGSQHDDLSSAEVQHDLNMWKGLVAALGLVFFFFTERCLTLVGEWRKQRQRRRKVPSRVRVMRDADNLGNSSVGEKLCKHKYSSYPYCYGEITTEMSDDHHHRNFQYEHKHNHTHSVPALDTTEMTTSGSVQETHPDGLDELRPMDTTCNSVAPGPDSEHGTDVNPSEAESYTVIIREHENKHHGHSHTHGHVHSPPDTLSSVAWMVVMGDGLHNFTDGMAIGAAFAANIAGGFSTAVAVFCHELPHELGDFAVLLKAGMSAKQAVFYNLLSSVLSLLGMVLGVFLGESETATASVFAAAAGMFLYIALVDMIPELTTSHSKEGGSLCQCLLQCVGLLSGIGIMLLIATYEHDLKTVFTDD